MKKENEKDLHFFSSALMFCSKILVVWINCMFINLLFRPRMLVNVLKTFCSIKLSRKFLLNFSE